MKDWEIIKVSELDEDIQERIADYPLKKKFDYIVIGASLTGVVVALELLKLDFKVLLIDKHRVGGGQAQTFNRKVMGIKYECDAMTDFISINKDGWLMKSIQSYMEDINIEFYRPNNMLTIVDKNNKFFDINNEYNKLLGSIKQHSPLAKEGVEKVVKVCSEVNDDILKINEIGRKYKNAYHFLEEVTNGNSFALEFLESFNNFFMRIPSHKMSAQNYIFNMGDFFLNGVYYPRKTFQNLINQMINTFEVKGGFFINKTEIMQLDFQNPTTVKSAKTQYGYNLKAGTYVSCIPNNNLFARVIDSKNINSKFNDNLFEKEKTANSYSRITLFLKDIPKENLNKRGYIYINENKLNHEEIYQAAVDNNLNEIPLMVCNYSALGKETVRDGALITITYLDFMDNWSMVKSTDYTAYRKNKDYLITKAKRANVILKRFLKIFPQVKPLINKIELATPHTFKRYLHTLNGNINGDLHLVDELWNLNSFQTPYKNLFLANNSTFPHGTLLGNWKTALHCTQLILSGLNRLRKQEQKKGEVNAEIQNKEVHFTELVDSYTYLLHIAQKYQPIKRYIGLQVGISFNNEEHYLIDLKETEATITKTSVDKANVARVYCWMPLPLFKDLVNGRTKVFKHTFQGTLRVTGGVKKFKKLVTVLAGTYSPTKRETAASNRGDKKTKKTSKKKK